MASVVHFQNQKYDKIKKQCEEQKSIFVDSLFPSTLASLGTAVETLAESEAVEWKRPRDLSTAPRFIQDGRRMADVTGGKLSPYWFLQALQTLSGIKELLFKVVVGAADQDLLSETYIGMFRFRFWRYGKWIEVVVDDSLPCSEGRLLFSHSSDPNQFWPCLLEKAYAKLVGSYGALEEGHISDALVDLTGGVTELIDMIASDVSTSEDSRAHLFHVLSAEMAEHSLVCASIQARKQEDIGERTQEGLAKGRMYHVTALKKIHIADIKLRSLFKGREKVAVIRVRDTRGSQGSSTLNSPTRSTDSSPEADEADQSASQLTKMLSKKAAWARLKTEDHGRFGLTIETEGEVWMPFEDFARYFHELVIVRLYNHNLFTLGRHWRDTAFHSSWSPTDRSGGGNTKSATYFQNPQFLIDISNEEEEIVIQLLQEGGLEPSSAGGPRRCQLAIGLAVFHVEGNRKYRLHHEHGFTPLAFAVDHHRQRELAYKGSLSRGRYLLVPSAFRVGSEGAFLLRVISQTNVNFREIVRDLPVEPCGLSCIASPVLWVTVISVLGATGLPSPKNVFCTVKCERQTGQTEICRDKSNDEVSWRTSLVFYRRKPERPIVIKVYNHNSLARNELLGVVELQARVNHAPTNLEVTLQDKDGSLLEGRQLSVQILTEDDLSAV